MDLKRNIGLGIVLTSLFAGSALAYSDEFANTDYSWYSGISFGAARLPHISGIFNDAGTNKEARADFDTGFASNVKLGMSSGSMRYEIEYIYNNVKAEAFKIEGTASTGVGGKVEAHTGMLNAYYDADKLDSLFTPYAGMGMGYTNIEGNVDTGTQNDHLTIKKGLFAYQGKLGVAYRVSENFVLTSDYAYMRTAKLDYKVRNTAGVKQNVRTSFVTHNLNIGFAYRF